MSRFPILITVLFVLTLNLGCGDNKTTLPPALTDEQKKAIKAEDEKVANEEGGKKASKKGNKGGK